MAKLRPITWSLAICLGTTLCACAPDQPAVCSLDEPVQLLVSPAPIDLYWVSSVDGDSDLVGFFSSPNSLDPEHPFGVYHAQPCEGAATIVARDSLWPQQDPSALGAAAGPTLFCGDSGRFIELDLTGEADPSPVLDEFLCGNVTATAHGTLAWIGDDLESASLWLLPDFPARTGGTRVLPSLAHTVYDPAAPDVLAYAPFDVELDTFVGGLRVVDLVTGVDTLVTAQTVAGDGSGARWIWAPEGPDASMNLYIHERGENVPLGPYSEAVDVPVPYGRPGPRAWTFNETRTHVLHLPWPDGATMQAFDLEGRPVALPLTRRPFVLTEDGGMLAPGDLSNEVQYARPGDATPRRLTYPPGVPNDQGTLRGSVIELLWDGQLWDVPLDGGPYRLVARGVGEQFARIDDTHLLTIYQDTLTTIDLRVGVRVEHAKGVDEMSAAGAGGYYYTIDPEYGQPTRSYHGLWYLPPAAITRPPENCPLVDCATDR